MSARYPLPLTLSGTQRLQDPRHLSATASAWELVRERLPNGEGPGELHECVHECVHECAHEYKLSLTCGDMSCMSTNRHDPPWGTITNHYPPRGSWLVIVRETTPTRFELMQLMQLMLPQVKWGALLKWTVLYSCNSC